MVERRKGVLFCRDDSEGVDPFHLSELKDIEKFHDMSVDVQSVLSRLMKHPCYKDIVLFPVVPPDIQEWYGEYRDSAVYGEDQDSNFLGKNDRSFMVLHNLLKRWPLMLKEVRSELTQKYVRQFLCVDPADGVPFWTTETPLANGLKLIRRRVEKPVLKELREADDSKEVEQSGGGKVAES
jgi:hypothetical protein